MQVQKGLVKYKDRSDIICTYGTAENGTVYYFLDGEKLSNGNIIASTTLVEAIDPLILASNIGVIDSEGNVVIPFDNKSIKCINNQVLLIEKANPVTQSVIDAGNLRKDPLSATKLVTTSATIKDKIFAKIGSRGRFVFNDQFSEVALCDLQGNNLFGSELFSFVGLDNDVLYLTKNTVDSPIVEYHLANDSFEQKSKTDDEINVAEALVDKSIIDNALSDGAAVGDDLNNQTADNSESGNTSVAEGETNNDLDNAETEASNSVVDFEESLNSQLINSVVPNELSKDSDFSEESLISQNEGDNSGNAEEKKIEEVNIFDNTSLDQDNALEGTIVENKDLDVSDVQESLLNFNSDDDKKDLSTSDLVNDNTESVFAASDEEDTANRDLFDSPKDFDSSSELNSFENDSVFSDTVTVMNKMISQIEEQRKNLSDYEDKLEKLAEFKRKAFEENKKLVHKYEELLQDYKNLESSYYEQKDMIASLKDEINSLKLQVSGKNDLAKLLVKAQNLLDEDDFQYTRVR